MLGLVLCGGQSSRMGSDKGLLKSEAKTWAQSAMDKISEINIPVKISVNSHQYADYAALFASTDIIIDDPLLSIKGPLLGILSCHLLFPGEDLFILACDMPMMTISLLHTLYKNYQQEPAFLAYVFTTGNEPEPLCGIYKSGGLSIVKDKLASGQHRKDSVKSVLDQLNVLQIPATPEERASFRNVNTHTELNGL